MANENSELKKLMTIVGWHSTLEQQVVAVKSLGEYGTKEALDFLKKIYTPTMIEEETQQVVFDSDDLPTKTYSRAREWRYDSAGTPLRDHLTIRLDTLVTHWYPDELLGEKEIEKRKQYVIAKNETHQLFLSTISKLEASLKQK